MDPDSCSQLFLLAVFLLLSALFTVAEATLKPLKKHRLRHIASEIDSRFLATGRLLHEPSGLFETIAVSSTLITVFASVCGTYLFLNLFGEKAGPVLTASVLAALVIVLGRVLPGTASARELEKVNLKLIKIFLAVMFILTPAVKFFNLFKLILAKMMRVEPPGQDGVTEEEIIELVTAGQEDGVIHQEEKTMIHGVFEFTDTLVRDVMVPRPDIVAVEKGTSLPRLIEIIKKEQFSRIPVYEKDIDSILGIVHIKDLLMAEACDKEDFSLSAYLRPALFVPETKKVNDLFRIMKKEKIHLGIVLDEYGGTAGLVTMEDLIEEIMGDIQDEHDTEEPVLRKIDTDTAEASGSMRLEELNEKLGLCLECEEAETVGGLIFAELGRLPQEDDRVRVNGIELTVLRMEGHRVEKVRLSMIKQDYDSPLV
ncbi:MAG: hemolysin family protein [Peptococcaceae bacterium]|nr:hemolysin family protein [Peptococcaceae bacterium]MDH7526108.1 hemolysin family protein [Peptococcaceae bacterium]